MMPDLSKLEALFNPAVVAVYGASERPESFGGRVLNNLIDGQFRGRVVAINSQRSHVRGLPAYKSATAYDGQIDLAMICVPGESAREVLDDCARAGVRAVAVLSGGFAESGVEGSGAQAALTAQARAAGIVVLGPNSLGIINTRPRLYASPSSALESARPPQGGVALISQSGAIAADLWTLLRERGVGLAYWVSTGNEADVTVAQCLEYIANDDRVRTVGLYLESIRDVEVFKAAAETCRKRGISLFAIKAGRSGRGATAVASHTAAVMNDDRLTQALFESLGVRRVSTTEDLANALRVSGLAPDTRLTIMSSSGGSGALAADEAEVLGVPFAEIEPAQQNALRELFGFGATANPIDLTAQTNQRPQLIRECLDALRPWGSNDCILLIHASGMAWQDRAVKITKILQDWVAEPDSPRMIFAGIMDPKIETTLEASGISVFRDPVEAVRTIRKCLPLSYASDTLGSGHPRPLPYADPSIGRIQGMLDENLAMDFLERSGIPVPRRAVVDDWSGLCHVLDDLHKPLALKALVPGMAHKTEVGAVRLGVETALDAERAFDALTTVCKQQGAPTRILVEEMVLEAITEVGVSVMRDPNLGPFVSVAAGGTWIEVMDDFVVEPAPVDLATAHAMLRRLRIWPILAGARGRPPAAIGELARVVAAVSTLLGDSVGSGSKPTHDTERRILSVEINPVLVGRDNATAVDALVYCSLGEGVHEDDAIDPVVGTTQNIERVETK